MSRLAEVLDRLAATIEARKGGDTGSSYTAQLLSDPAKLEAREGTSGLIEKASR